MSKAAHNLGITAEQIAHANQMIADGNGGNTVAEELGLNKCFRPIEYDGVLADLGLEW